MAVGIGIVAGLRSLTAPAVVAWAAHLGWLNLHSSPLAFMASTAAVAVFSLLAIGELIADKLPNTPKRTALAPLLARVLTGALCGACLCVAAGKSLRAGAILGGSGSIRKKMLRSKADNIVWQTSRTTDTSHATAVKHEDL